MRNATVPMRDRVSEFTYKISGGRLAAMFDGTEKVLSLDSFHWYNPSDLTALSHERTAMTSRASTAGAVGLLLATAGLAATALADEREQDFLEGKTKACLNCALERAPLKRSTLPAAISPVRD